MKIIRKRLLFQNSRSNFEHRDMQFKPLFQVRIIGISVEVNKPPLCIPFMLGEEKQAGFFLFSSHPCSPCWQASRMNKRRLPRQKTKLILYIQPFRAIRIFISTILPLQLSRFTSICLRNNAYT